MGGGASQPSLPVDSSSDGSSNPRCLSVASSEPDLGMTYELGESEVVLATVNELEEVKKLALLVKKKFPDRALVKYLLQSLNEIDAYARRVPATDISFLNMIIDHGICERKYLSNETALNYSNLLLELLKAEDITLARIIRNRPPVEYQDFLDEMRGRNVTVEDDILRPTVTKIIINESRFCSGEALYLLAGSKASVIAVWQRLYPSREFEVLYR